METQVLEKQEETKEPVKRGRPKAAAKEAPAVKAEPTADYFAWGKETEVTYTTGTGETHGFIDSVSNAVADHGFKNMSEPNRRDMLAKKRRALEPVNYTYYHLKNPKNGKIEFWYGADWPGEPQRKFKLLNGHTYRLPRGAKDKLDELGAPQRSGLIGTDGHPLAVDGPKQSTHLLVRAD